MDKIKLAVFDLDGVLIDSEPLHKKAKERILADYGVEDSINLDATVGHPNEALWEKIIEGYHLMATPDDLVLMQNNHILSMMKNGNMGATEGLLELLGELKSSGIKIGLASSSVRYYVQNVLKWLNLEAWFDYSVTGDEVNHRKPDPECYLKVIKMAGVEPSEAIAIEDSAAGVKAAVAAGMTCFGFINPGSGNQDLSPASSIVNALWEIISIVKKRL